MQQVLPNIVQQVLATLQPPESARVGQQMDIPNIVQQVLPNIVQQVLATLQPPESARVGQQMDTANRSSRPQQPANSILTEHYF